MIGMIKSQADAFGGSVIVLMVYPFVPFASLSPFTYRPTVSISRGYTQSPSVISAWDGTSSGNTLHSRVPGNGETNSMHHLQRLCYNAHEETWTPAYESGTF